jgi:hypothetical protein
MNCQIKSSNLLDYYFFWANSLLLIVWHKSSARRNETHLNGINSSSGAKYPGKLWNDFLEKCAKRQLIVFLCTFAYDNLIVDLNEDFLFYNKFFVD